MIRKGTLAIACTTAAVLGTLAAPAQATTFNLKSLVDNQGSFTVGDKQFKDFSCSILASPGASPKNCNNIDILTLDNDPFGIRFQSFFNAAPNSNLQVFIDYTVEALAPDKAISGAQLSFNGAFVGPNAKTSVTQTIKDLSDVTVGILNVSNPNPTDLQDPAFEPTDTPLSQLLKQAKVGTEIKIETGAGSRGFISFVDQRFEQDTIEVPEPGTISGLLAIGSLGVGSILKQLKQKK